jgi:hypothetical protein
MPKKRDIGFYIENIRNFSIKIPWDVFVKILTSCYGCEMESNPGSARVFVKGEIRFTAHAPHGREKFVSKPDRERAIKYLINVVDL